MFTLPETGPCNGIELHDDGCPQVSCGGFLMTRLRTHVDNIANGRLMSRAIVCGKEVKA